MGTLMRVKLFAADEQQARAAFAAVFERIRDLNTILSDYAADSELNRVCMTAVGHPTRVSEDLFRVLAASQELSLKTDGAFDVTLGPVIRLWREQRREGRLPNADALREASGRSGFRKLHLDVERREVLLDQAGMQIDVGGIAKGYTADAALAVLRERGIRRALVALSGDIVVGDPPPGKSGWKIGVQGSGDEFGSVLELQNVSVSTSGDAEQHLDAGGKRYSHIIDPATGLGLSDGVTVTVVAPLGVLADGYATAVSLLGVERGLAFLEEQDQAEALFSVRENGESRRIESSGFRRFAVEISQSERRDAALARTAPVEAPAPRKSTAPAGTSAPVGQTTPSW